MKDNRQSYVGQQTLQQAKEELELQDQLPSYL